MLLPVELYLVERGKLLPFQLKSEEVRLGFPIYIHFNVDKNFHYSVIPKKDHTPFYVSMIERVSVSNFASEDPIFSNGAIRLWMRDKTPPSMNDNYIDNIYEAVQSKLTREEVASAIQNATLSINTEKMGLTSARRASAVNTFFTVAQRLDLCRKLAGHESADLIHTHQRNLVVYLLLTCFDRLGQPAPYITFEQFLSSKKLRHRELRDKVLLGCSGANPLESAAALNTLYIEIYGVRNSFYRFLEEILSESMCQRLLDSLGSWKASWGETGREPMSPTEKKKYLYSLRNSYTHQAETQPGLTIPLPISEEGEKTPPEKMFYFYEQLNKKDGFDWIGFSQWPDILFECVEEGLTTALKTHIHEL